MYAINKLIAYLLISALLLQSGFFIVFKPIYSQPYFWALAPLFAAATIILLTGTIVFLRTLNWARKNKIGSTAFLNYHLQNLATTGNKNFDARACLYAINHTVDDLEKDKQILRRNKQSIEMLLEEIYQIDGEQENKTVLLQNKIAQIQQQELQLLQVIHRVESIPNQTTYRETLEKIYVNPVIKKLPANDPIFPKQHIPKIIMSDRQYFTNLVKELNEMVALAKVFISVLPHELQRREKKLNKHHSQNKDEILTSKSFIRFLYSTKIQKQKPKAESGKEEKTTTKEIPSKSARKI